MALDPILAGALIDGSAKPEWSNVRIFGKRLRKFSLWHKFILKTIGSPFMEKKPVTLRDLRTAVGVCRLKFPDSNIQRPIAWPAIERVGLVLAATVKRGNAKEGEDNLVQRALRKRVDAFLNYTADYLQTPEYTVIPPDTNGVLSKPHIPRGKAPDEIGHVADLIGWTKWDDVKIWNLPIGYANWLRVMAKKESGLDVDFVTDKEREFRESLPPEYRHGQ